MELNFTARSLAKLETKLKMPFTDLLGVYSVTNILDLIWAGVGNDEAKAAQELDKYLADGGELQNLLVEIMRGLQDKGFLPRALDLTNIKENLDKTIKDEMEKAMPKL